MKSNYQRTADWLKACGKEPTTENLSVQIGCHIEEFLEFLLHIQIVNPYGHDNQAVYSNIWWSLDRLAQALKNQKSFVSILNREKVLDALCDSEVTGNGVAYLAEFNKEAADTIILDSNDAKLVDNKPIILPGGKIGKPEGWIPPDLSKFV